MEIVRIIKKTRVYRRYINYIEGGFRTKKDAQVAAAEVEAELSKGVAPHLRPEPFDTYFEEWINVYKSHVVNNTLERYLSTLKTIREYFGSKPLQDIKAHEYQQFMNEYGKSRSRSTSDKLNSHVRACVKQAIDEGIIRVDFTRNVNKTGRKGKRKEDKHLDYKESEELYKHLMSNLERSPTYYLLLLGLVSGMRFTEMVGLKRDDLILSIIQST